MTVEMYSNPNEENDDVFISYEDSDIEERAAHIAFSSDPVKDYLRQIGKTPLLNAEQEVELAKRIEVGLFASSILIGESDGSNAAAKPEELLWLKADGEQAKDHLIRANLRLVVSLAKRYTGRGMLFLDLIQEGNLGLDHAAKKFDYQKGYKFSTYATWWIRQAITRSMADQSRTIRIPVHKVEKINKFQRTQMQLTNELGREPTIDELASSLDVKPREINSLLEIIRQAPISLNLPIGEAGGRGQTETEFGDILEDKTSLNLEQQVQARLLKIEIEKVLDRFDEREAGVIRMRYGLDGSGPETLEVVGKVYGVTRERIRQLEQKAMKQLRKAGVSDHLRDYL